MTENIWEKKRILRAAIKERDAIEQTDTRDNDAVLQARLKVIELRGDLPKSAPLEMGVADSIHNKHQLKVVLDKELGGNWMVSHPKALIYDGSIEGEYKYRPPREKEGGFEFTATFPKDYAIKLQELIESKRDEGEAGERKKDVARFRMVTTKNDYSEAGAPLSRHKKEDGPDIIQREKAAEAHQKLTKRAKVLKEKELKGDHVAVTITCRDPDKFLGFLADNLNGFDTIKDRFTDELGLKGIVK